MATDLTPVTRLEKILANLIGEAYDITPVTRIEKLFDNLLDGSYAVIPATRIEKFISDLKEAGYDLTAVTRIEKFLNKTAAEAGLVPVTRLEKFLDAIELQQNSIKWTAQDGDMLTDSRFNISATDCAFTYTPEGMLYEGSADSSNLIIRPSNTNFDKIVRGFIRVKFKILSRGGSAQYPMYVLTRADDTIQHGLFTRLAFWYSGIYNWAMWRTGSGLTQYRQSEALVNLNSDYDFKAEINGLTENPVLYLNDAVIADNLPLSNYTYNTDTRIRCSQYFNILIEEIEIFKEE